MQLSAFKTVAARQVSALLVTPRQTCQYSITPIPDSISATIDHIRRRSMLCLASLTDAAVHDANSVCGDTGDIRSKQPRGLRESSQ